MFPQVFGKYVLERELGRGGMARVFEATLQGAGGFRKKLVVKQILPELSSDPAFVRRFVEEAKTAVALTHPGIVPVYELGVESGVYFLSMEYCAGVSLAALLAHGGRLDPDHVAHLGAELCGALDYAHRRGVIHRDVTPHNVLIDEEGAVHLIDFGIAARVTAAGLTTQGLTTAGLTTAGPGCEVAPAEEVFGSPGHMPPEQVRGERLTPAADTFALGALLLEASTGVAPFRRSTEDESLRAVGRPPLEASVPAPSPLRDCLLRAVAPRPSARPEPIANLARELRRTIRERDVGDLARALGERVCAARHHATSRSERAAHPAEGATPTRPITASETKTFATRPLADAPAPTPPADPTPEHATRRLEQPPGNARPSDPPRRLRLWGVAIAAAVGLLALAWLGRANHRDEGAAHAQVASSVASASLVAPSRAAARPAAEALSTPSAAERSPSSHEPPASPPAAGAPLASSSATPRPPVDARQRISAATPTGQVALTAAPRAQVEIAGRRLTTPVEALPLSSGVYRATFRSPTWEGPVSIEVSVRPDALTRVHADFTTEPPRILTR